MKRTYAFLIFLLSIYIVSSINKTDVFYDSKYDIIFHNGKLYFPSKNNGVNNPSNQTINNNNTHSNADLNINTHANSNLHHEEELVEGATFWVYIFIILCKFNNSSLF